MYFNSSDCNFNDPQSHCDNMNMGQTCLICFSDETSLNFDKSASDTHLLFDTCCKYLHSAITNQVVMGQKNGTNFCSRCFESADQLAYLTDKMEVFQKTVSEYILMFSLEILQRRAIRHQKAENIDVFTKNLVLCDLSGVSDFKETVTKTQDLSFQAPSNPLEFESSIFEVNGIQEQNILGDPLIIPGEPISTNVVTFETIIKTERNENEFTLQNYEQSGEVGELQLSTQHEGVAHYQKNVLEEQILQRPPRSRRTGKRVTNKLNLIPFVQLERLKLPGNSESSTSTESGNSNVLNTNSFNMGRAKVYGNEQLLLQSKKALSVVDTAKSIFVNKMAFLQQGTVARYRPRSNKELDPDYEADKTSQCSFCQKTFRNKHTLKSHIRAIHTNDKRFKCTHCTKRFLHRGNLNVHLKTHAGKKRYKCRFCGRISVTLSDFNRHLTSAHTLEMKTFSKSNTQLSSSQKFEEELNTIKQNAENEKSYVCPVCQKQFTYKTTLMSHFRVHPQYRPYKCSVCSKTFRYQSNYSAHKKSHTKTPEMLGSQQFTSKQVLSSHFRIHTGERPYKCSICNRTFRFQSNHIVHMKLHHAPTPTPENKLPEESADPERPFQCSECSKKFSTQGNLVTHFRIHTGEKPFKCSICNKAFRHKHVLKIHVCKNIDLITAANEEEEMEIPNPAIDSLMFFTTKKEIRIIDTVTTEKLNACQCSACGKTFSGKTNLETHFRIHTGEKPFKCDRCDYACNQAANLAKHKSHRHSIVVPFKCRDCGRRFKTAASVKQHYKSVHFAIDFTNECILENSDIGGETYVVDSC